MVKPTTPVNDDICTVFIQARGSTDTPAGIKLAEFKEAIKDGTILAHIEPLELTRIIRHVVGSDNLEEVDVIIRMESCHGGGAEKARAEDIHFFIQAVVDYEIVRHAYTMGLHGVALTVVVITHLGVVKV